MNITVNVDEVTLATVVEEVVGYDEEGEPRTTSGTMAQLVAAQLVDRITKDARYPRLVDQVIDIRREVIKDAVVPMIEEAVKKQYQRTDSWGERTGEPVTLRDTILKEADKILKQPVDSYNRGQGTLIQKIIREEVMAAFSNEIRDAVKLARKQVAGEVGQQVATAVENAMRGR